MRTILPLSAALVLACGSPAAEPKAAGPEATATATATAKADSGPIAPITATVERGGETFTFGCSKLASEVVEADQAARSDALAFLSCSDPKSGLSVNATIPLGVGEISPPPDESNGRLGVLLLKNPSDRSAGWSDIVTTSSRSTAEAHRGKGSIRTKTWDAASGRLEGSATMTWEKDGTGKPGSMTIQYDVTLPKP